jgi:hypothetical protein
MRPDKTFNNVDFPQPLGPVRARLDFAGTKKSGIKMHNGWSKLSSNTIFSFWIVIELFITPFFTK